MVFFLSNCKLHAHGIALVYMGKATHARFTTERDNLTFVFVYFGLLVTTDRKSSESVAILVFLQCHRDFLWGEKRDFDIFSTTRSTEY